MVLSKARLAMSDFIVGLWVIISRPFRYIVAKGAMYRLVRPHKEK